MKLTIKKICPECHGDACLDREASGWSATCPKCPHRVQGHSSPIGAMRAFRTIEVRQQVISSRGGRMKANNALHR